MIPVVAAALIRSDGKILMQQRRFGAVHGGLWEFPGGKIETGESPRCALLREIREELAVDIEWNALTEAGFASDPTPPSLQRAPHVILLYTCRRWSGQPVCLDGEQIGWFEAAEIMQLDMPPLDYPLAEQLLRLLRDEAI